MWDASKTVLTGKFILLNSYIRKEEMYPIHKLWSYIEKQQQKIAK